MPAISFLISLLVRLLVLFLLSSLRQEILVKVSDIGVDSAIKTNYCELLHVSALSHINCHC